VSGLYAISDLRVGFAESKGIRGGAAPGFRLGLLVVAGDIGEYVADVKDDPMRRRGEWRYQRLVAMCRALVVIRPEDPFPL
jgi:hypothetical protein